VDEAELTEINNFHALFIESWPKDIRGERSFVEGQIQYWTQHRNTIRDWVKSRERRLENMAPDHANRTVETKELEQKKNSALPMAEQELDQLRAFLATYDKIEQRKLTWYKLSKVTQTSRLPKLICGLFAR
jgi:D-mannonate dehydratase